MCFDMSVGSPTYFYILIVLLLLPRAASSTQFTPKYQGKTVTGLVGSSVNFAWSFSGDVKIIDWGIKHDVANYLNTSSILVSLDQSGSVSVSVPAAYTGRVTGTRHGDSSSGQAVFTLRSVKKEDENVYGCKLTSSGFFPTFDFDYMKLVVEEAPKFIHPTQTNASYNDGSPVDISCTAQGTPDPDVRWIYNGKEKSSGSKTAHLIFIPISKADAGTYTCRANNSAGIKEKQLHVFVNYKPAGTTIKTNVAQNTAVEGDSVSLTCHVTDANPPVSEFRFYVNNSNTPLNTVKNSNQYTIQGLQRSKHYGEYKCVAHNDVGDGQSNALVLNINGPPDITHISGNQTVDEGNEVFLNCIPGGEPKPNITWTRLFDNIVVTFPLTVIKQDSGGYRCIADNGVGNPATADVFITVQYAPTVKGATPLTTQYWIGQTVTLKCEAEGVPTPTITWKNPSGVEVKKVTALENTANVVLNDDKDFGHYTCEAKNGVGAAATKIVQVQQIIPANIQFLTGNLTVNERDAIDLRCDVSGYPAPIISWKKDGKQIKPTGNELHIISSKRSDTGAYFCTADNGVGQAVHMKTYVVVNYQATITYISSSVSKSWIGQTVTLTCKSDGVPTPNVSWYKPDGTKLNPVTAKENKAVVTLNLDGDFGLYNCTADNGFLLASKTVLVEQIKAPGPPIITSTEADIQATSLTVKWTEPTDTGGSPVTSYRVVILKGVAKIKKYNITDPTSRSWLVGELEKSTNYTVKVFARNYVFEGNAVGKIFKTKFRACEDNPSYAEGPGGCAAQAAVNNYCNDYYDFMSENCAKSCGFCSEVTTQPPTSAEP